MGAAAQRPTGADTGTGAGGGTGEVITHIPIQGSVGCNLYCILLHLFTEDNYASAEDGSLLALQYHFFLIPVGSHDPLTY